MGKMEYLCSSLEFDRKHWHEASKSGLIAQVIAFGYCFTSRQVCFPLVESLFDSVCLVDLPLAEKQKISFFTLAYPFDF